MPHLPLLRRHSNEFNQDRYILANPEGFPYDTWVPTLAEITQAKTFEEQRTALSIGIASVNGCKYGLVPTAEGHAHGRLHTPGDVRFRITDSRARLSYVKVVGIKIGYQTPDTKSPHPAYAVVDGPNKYHRVVARDSEELSDMETEASLFATYALAIQLHETYPGYEVFPKLTDAGIVFATEE